MSLQDQFQEDERAGFIKQIADKLYQGIVEAYDTPETQKRRWIWELVQNAKDVSNIFGSVLIRVTLNKGFVLFEHNGDPFQTKSLTGLIQQVSSKASTSNNAATTGKFGTGFISTHMLSKKITVTGLLEYGDQYKSFEIELDREAASPEELAIKVKQLLKTKDSLTDDTLYPPVPKSAHIRNQNDFDSKFYYELKPETSGYAKQGLEDLIKTGPYALLINATIGQFEIIDQICSTTTVIKKRNDEQVYPVEVFSTDIIKGDGNSVISLAHRSNSDKSIIVSLPVKISEGIIKEISPLPFTVPVLFKEFPLIGTEAWMFGFTCHSQEFQPKEPRDGLRLHIESEEDSGQAKTNRKLLQEAVMLASEFVKELSEISPLIENTHLLAQSALPASETKENVITFLKELQIVYRNEIKTLKIVQTTGGPKTMMECKFPVLEYRDIPDQKANESFFNLCEFRFSGLLPLQNNYSDWRRIIEAEIDTWGIELTLSLNDVLEETKSWNNINLIKPSDKDSKVTVIEWLNALYIFLSANQLEFLHKNYQIIPNQKGNLISLSDAIKDADKNIPEILKDVSQAFDKKYRDNLADDRVHCNELYSTLSIEAISKDLATDIGNLKKPDAIEFVQLSALIQLCRIPTGLSTADDNRRTAMVEHLSAMIPEWREVIETIPAMSDFNFNPSMRVLVRWCLYQIANTEKISVLMESLFGMENEDQVVEWLNTLAQLVQEYDDFSSYLEINAIYPNQLGELCSRKTLAADIDIIPEVIKDIHDSILSEVKLRKKLLHLKFNSDKVDGKISFHQVAGEIDLELRDNESNMESPKIRDAALNIINWLSAIENEKHTKKFAWIDGNKATIVLKTLDKDREHIFKILRSNQDFKRLADIASNEHFEVLADLVDSGYNIMDLKKVYEMALQAGGVDVVEKKLANILEEKQDFVFRMELGTHVENLFKEIFKEIDRDFDVRREPTGQDFILFIPEKWEYRVEIKSFAMGRNQVHMSMKQGETSSKYPDTYSLCVLERPAELKLATIDYFKAHALFVPDIGIRLKNRVIAAAHITEIIDENNSDEVGIDFDSKDYKYRIGKKIFAGESSLSFDRFLEYIKLQIQKL